MFIYLATNLTLKKIHMLLSWHCLYILILNTARAGGILLVGIWVTCPSIFNSTNIAPVNIFRSSIFPKMKLIVHAYRVMGGLSLNNYSPSKVEIDGYHKEC